MAYLGSNQRIIALDLAKRLEHTRVVRALQRRFLKNHFALDNGLCREQTFFAANQPEGLAEISRGQHPR
jgi:hypothetical protein